MPSADSNSSLARLIQHEPMPKEAAAFVREKFASEAEAGEGEVRVHSALKASDLTRELVLAGFNVYGVSEEEVRLEDLFMHAVHGGSEEE